MAGRTWRTVAAVAVVAVVAAGCKVTREDPQSGAEHSPGGEVFLPDQLLGMVVLLDTGDPDLIACAQPAQPPVVEPGADDVDAVRTATEQLREMELTRPVTVELVEAAEMSRRVEAAFADAEWDKESAQVDAAWMAALGAVPPGIDLVAVWEMALMGTAGGYDAEEGLTVRVNDRAALTPLERVVLAHEYEHALTDEHLTHPDTDPYGLESYDAYLAQMAVVEGSAVLTMRMYAEAVLSATEKDLLQQELHESAAEARLRDFSPFMVEEIRFPYTEGLRYMCNRWLSGGWQAVNEAYDDPPRTTAEVLFPERHGEAPRQPTPLGHPGAGWRLDAADAFGAAELLWLLEAPGGDRAASLPEPRERVRAWDGGELEVWVDGAEVAVGISLVDRGEEFRLCDTLHDWYVASFPEAVVAIAGARTTFRTDAQHATLTCVGAQVRLGIAGSAVPATALAD